MVRLRDSWPFSLSSVPTVGNPCRPLQPESVSGDNNAIHTNEEFAVSTVFKGRIAHGMLSASVISAAIANKLPGPGTIYMSQSLRFRAPVRAGDTVRATVTVK